jgi:hypothetical protein
VRDQFGNSGERIHEAFKVVGYAVRTFPDSW